MSLILAMLLLGGSSAAIWAGITDPEGGLFEGLSNIMDGTPNAKHVSTTAAAFLASIANPAATSGGGGGGGKGGGGGGGNHATSAQGGPKAGSKGSLPTKGGSGTSNGKAGNGGSSWGLRPRAAKAAREIANKFGIHNVGGFSYRANTADPSSLSDHAFGLAADFMGGKQNLADYAVANHGRLHIHYVIYNHRIWTTERGWHAYTGPNPHTDHVHVSFFA